MHSRSSMKKKEREVVGLQDIVAILARCDTVRLGLNGDDYPYVVPLSFGYEVVDGRIVIYVHGGKEGHKHNLITRDKRVCVEADTFKGYRRMKFGVTAAFESIIGFGTIEEEDREGSIRGLDLMMEHCRAEDLSSVECIELGITTVYRITLEEVTGKATPDDL
jgi:nitroimidazol reductase NimA-like FMN-containing flavoprotein (pyridoxamine 5'-phosphate oxidase superfamily)